MNYSELSDFEINALVEKYDKPKSPKNYCGLAEHAWPIIADNKINILFDWNTRGIVGATGAWPMQEYEDANPLRAAMVVYLMMQEQQHDQTSTTTNF